MTTVLWYLWLCMAIMLGMTCFFVIVRFVLWLGIAAYRGGRWILGKPNSDFQMSRLPSLSILWRKSQSASKYVLRLQRHKEL